MVLSRGKVFGGEAGNILPDWYEAVSYTHLTATSHGSNRMLEGPGGGCEEAAALELRGITFIELGRMGLRRRVLQSFGMRIINYRPFHRPNRFLPPSCPLSQQLLKAFDLELKY